MPDFQGHHPIFAYPVTAGRVDSHIWQDRRMNPRMRFSGPFKRKRQATWYAGNVLRCAKSSLTDYPCRRRCSSSSKHLRRLKLLSTHSRKRIRIPYEWPKTGFSAARCYIHRAMTGPPAARRSNSNVSGNTRHNETQSLYCSVADLTHCAALWMRKKKNISGSRQQHI